MQHGEENSSFYGKLETPVVQQSRQDLVDGTGLPEPLKDERRSNFGVARGEAAGAGMRAEEAQLFGEPRERLHQRVELAAGEEFVEAAEAGQDALLHLAVGPDVIDEKQVGSGTVGLGADEQGCAPVSPSLPPFHARNKEYMTLIWDTRDTRFPRKTIPRYVESVSYDDFESQSVEDEPKVTPTQAGL